MRARRVIASFAVLTLVLPIAYAGEPKPTAVDIKALRDKLVVLEDAQGGTYVVFQDEANHSDRAWYAAPGEKTKTFYEQIVITRYRDGSTGAWDIGVWAPRIPGVVPGSIARSSEGKLNRSCGDKLTPLTQLPADRTKQVLDKATFMSTALIRRPHMLARDDSGTYYYVDVIRDQYGGSGYRIFVGKKGGMKQLPLTDVATDTAGDVFATKTGDVRIVHANSTNDTKASALWVKGEKRTQLITLDTDANSRLIFKDLGIYSFLGTICDDI